jgi:hypothetical protein
VSILNISNDNDIYGCWDGKHIGSWLVAFKFLPFSMEKEKREFTGKKNKIAKAKARTRTTQRPKSPANLELNSHVLSNKFHTKITRKIIMKKRKKEPKVVLGN